MTTNTTTQTTSEIVLALYNFICGYEAYQRMTAKERRHASMKGANMMPLDKRTEVLETEAMRLRVDMGELEEIAREQMEDDQNV